MMVCWRLVVLLVVSLAQSAWSLEVPPTVPLGEFVIVTHDAGSFIDITPERSEKQRFDVSNTVVHFTGLAGKYSILEAIPPTDGEAKWIKNTATVTIGAVGPEPPGPEPPGPGPGPVVPPVVTPGKRFVVIVHESEDDTVAFNAMKVQLRTGGVAQYLVANGHKLLILDEEAHDELGQPLKLLQELKAAGLAAPALFIIDESGKVVYKATLPTGATATGVLDLVKEYD